MVMLQVLRVGRQMLDHRMANVLMTVEVLSAVNRQMAKVLMKPWSLEGGWVFVRGGKSSRRIYHRDGGARAPCLPAVTAQCLPAWLDSVIVKRGSHTNEVE
jgi:hypothetical protein